MKSNKEQNKVKRRNCRAFLETVKKAVLKLIMIFIISLTLFYSVTVPYKLYAVLACCLCIYTLVGFKRVSNEVFVEVSLLLISNGTAYVAVKLIQQGFIYVDTANILLTIVLAVLGCVVFCFAFKRNKNNEKREEITLFPQRESDLQNVKKYLLKFNTIGINGVWGSGKTVLIEQLKTDDEIAEKYEFVVIDLLSCNLDEIQVSLLNELQNALSRNRIYSAHSNQLKNILGSVGFFDKIKNVVFPDNTSYRVALTGFKNDINKMGKSIIIVFEDIDRISSKDVIEKIFSISEHLSCSKIKVIYQYDQSKLENLGFDRNYSEKYIPFVINLTEISLFDSIELCFSELNIDERILDMSDFNFLRIPLSFDYYLQSVFGLNITFGLTTYDLGIRKPKQFLMELSECFHANENYKDALAKKAVITFYVVKHFFDDIYRQINVAESLLDTLKFKHEDNNYTIFQIITMYKPTDGADSERKLSEDDLNIIINEQSNRCILAVLNWFGYNFDIDRVENNFTAFANEDSVNISKKNKNEKIDRIIWHLWASGKSEYTDYENAASKMISTVLCKPKEEQDGAFEEFWKMMFDGRNDEVNRSDNNTIFLLGIPPFISLFKAFYVATTSSDNWLKLIDFYFNHNKIEKIDEELIATLFWCNIAIDGVYLNVLSRFTELTVVGNLNLSEAYLKFILRFLGALSSNGYINTHLLSAIRDKKCVLGSEGLVIHILDSLEKELEKAYEYIPLECVKKNIKMVIDFIEVNKRIINSETRLNNSKPRISTTVSSKYTHQEEYDRLLLVKDCDGFLEEIEKSYGEGKISVYEINDLLHKFNV